MKTDKNDKIVIKQFRDVSSNFWVDTVHYSLTQEGTIIFCAGGLDKEELRDVLNAYIKRNKKVFKDIDKTYKVTTSDLDPNYVRSKYIRKGNYVEIIAMPVWLIKSRQH